MTTPLTFGLNLTRKRPAAAAATATLFAPDDDDEDAAATTATAPPLHRPPQHADALTTTDAVSADASIYDYDAHYDRMKHVERLRTASRRGHDATAHRAPRYMRDIMASAELRRKEHALAEERMIQRQRAKEGDEFADKERFVTSAYKQHMNELRQTEQQQQQRDEAQAPRRHNLSGFYKGLLEQRTLDDASHETPALEDAASTMSPGDSDTQALEHARAQGLRVQLNDSAEVVDKRDLLVAGLNVPTAARRGPAVPTTARTQGAASRSASSPHATHRQPGQREAARLQQQYEAQAHKARQQAQAARHSVAAKLAKRTTADTAAAARERYLQRLHAHAPAT